MCGRMADSLPYPALHATHGGIWIAWGDGRTETVGRGQANGCPHVSGEMCQFRQAAVDCKLDATEPRANRGFASTVQPRTPETPVCSHWSSKQAILCDIATI